MSFLSGAFLIALASIAVPVIIHLIHRQRYPDRAFTTLRFFDKTIKHNVIQRRLIDKILLALRILALIAIVVGLARPFWGAAIGEKRMSVVIVIDNSPSMARLRQGKPLLDYAKTVASAVIDQLGPSDRAEILLTAPLSKPDFTTDHERLLRELELRAGQPTALIVQGEENASLSLPGLTTDAKQLRDAIGKLPASASAALASYDNSPSADFGYDATKLRHVLETTELSAAPGDMRSAMTRAGELLQTSRDGDRKVVVISDMQDGEWEGQSVKTLSGFPVTLIAAEPDPAAGANLAIERCEIEQREAGLGQNITATAVVRNHSAQASDQSTLTAIAGERGRPVEIKLPAIPGKRELRVNIPLHILGKEREMLCSVSIKSLTDPFEYDNTWNFQIGIRPGVQTLCVNGFAGATGPEKETFFLMNALATRGSGADAPVSASECEMEELKDKQLFQFGVVILADVPTLDEPTRKKLHDFVSDGGGLLVFPGAKATADEYNGWDFLPARIAEAKTASFVYLKSIDDKDPVVADMKDRVGSGIHALSTDAWLKLDAVEGAHVLARFSDGSPALVERRVGNGRVVLAATSCHASHSDWPLRPAFVILLRSLVQHLGSPLVPATIVPDRIVGQTAATMIPADLTGGTPATFQLSTVDGSYAYVGLPWMRRDTTLLMPAASSPGHYLLTIRQGTSAGMLSEPGLGAKIVPVSVNHSTQESDLAAAPADRAQQFLTDAKITNKTLGPDAADAVANLRSGRDLWRLLLLAGLAFLVIESLLAGRTPSEAAN